MNIKEQLIEWFKEIARFQKIEDFFKPILGDFMRQDIRFIFFTKDNEYTIGASYGSTNEKGYLGCVVSKRKPRAGEDWTRGNDLPDGDFSYETWQKIKNAIIANELVKVVKAEREKADSEVSGIAIKGGKDLKEVEVNIKE